MSQPTYRLQVPERAVSVPALDEYQQQVVDHPGGPLLVLAGPGTGKTTTLVEAIVERIQGRGARPDEVLALTFSRKAAEELRDRITARLGRTTTSGTSSTFHSFAYGLIRAYAPAELYEAPLRLLSAPEQDVVLRELLEDHPESVGWPSGLGRALGTRGFAREVHSVLARAREKGLDGAALTELGRSEGIAEFVAAGQFLEQYLTVLDHLGATDYADLIRRAALEAETHRDELRARYRYVFVDEFQDTDPGQVALLRALAGDGRDLVAVGDPHQSIYGFRGAEVRGILQFPSAFPHADGRPADVVALRTTRRFGARILTASQRVAGRLGLPGTIDDSARQAFLSPQAAPGPHGPGRVEVLTFDTERAEAEHLADLLRRAHLEDGIAWDDMAVLVRSGRASIPPLRRALAGAGVPVEVASDEVPLVRDPAVFPLLEGLRAVLNLDNHDAEDVDHLDAGQVETLLTSPLGGLDAGELRRLARRLRARDKERATTEQRSPRTSRELTRELLVDPEFLTGVEGPEAERARALTRLLHGARAQADAGATAEELLWSLWSGTGWPARLRRVAEAGGAGARRAHRELDAVCALFEVAARAEEKRDHVGVRTFLATLVAQEIPADTLADRGVRGAAVRLLTAHRSKGLEWRLVVVAHVQAEAWPDLRRRSTLLRADRIGEEGVVPPISPRELLSEERRLFYVACTRARERLVVTAVHAQEEDGELPSRFLDELGVHPQRRVGRPSRPLSMAGLISELRRTVADPSTSEPLRTAAAKRLARLAPEVPAADPATWWGTRRASRAERPLRAPEHPVPISATMLEGVQECPMKWFLTKEAGGAGATHQSANVGQLVHAVAERVAAGELPEDPARVDELMEHIDRVWDRLVFRTPWSKAREHARVRAALERFVAWHRGNPRRLLDTEVPFSTEVEVSDGQGGPIERVRLKGYADRIELDTEGRVVVVDLKTGRTKPSDKSVREHTQLSLYQLAIDHGAVDDLLRQHSGDDEQDGHDAGTSGGAELVQVGLTDGDEQAAVQPQPVQPDDGPTREALRAELAVTARLVRSEHFPARASDAACRTCEFHSLCPIKGAGAVTR